MPPLARALAHLCRGEPEAARGLLPSLDFRQEYELALLLDALD